MHNKVLFGRNEGRHNQPYDVRKGSSRSVLTIHKNIARHSLRPDPEVTEALAEIVDYDLPSMTRDDLRALAKERGLTGYGKLNKAGLIALLESTVAA